jgi:hypothetical protein
MAKSNSDLSRAQFVPNTVRICGHSRLITVSLFLCRYVNRLARASRVSSSKLAMRVRFSSPALSDVPSQGSFRHAAMRLQKSALGPGHNVGH